MLPQTAAQLMLFVNILYQHQQNITKGDVNNKIPVDITTSKYDATTTHHPVDSHDEDSGIAIDVPEEEGVAEIDDAMILDITKRTLETVLETINSDAWVQKSKNAKEGDLVYGLKTPDPKLTTLLADTELDIAPEKLYHELWFRARDTPKWNPTVSNVTILKEIGDNTRIMYQTTTEAAGGAVSSREFVNLNSWFLIDGVYYLVYESADNELYPQNENYVRAYNGPSALIVGPSKENPGKTRFRWLMNCDFRFTWFSTNLLKKIMPTVMLDYLNTIRKHLPDIE